MINNISFIPAKDIVLEDQISTLLLHGGCSVLPSNSWLDLYNMAFPDLNEEAIILARNVFLQAYKLLARTTFCTWSRPDMTMNVLGDLCIILTPLDSFEPANEDILRNVILTTFVIHAVNKKSNLLAIVASYIRWATLLSRCMRLGKEDFLPNLLAQLIGPVLSKCPFEETKTETTTQIGSNGTVTPSICPGVPIFTPELAPPVLNPELSLAETVAQLQAQVAQLSAKPDIKSRLRVVEYTSHYPAAMLTVASTRPVEFMRVNFLLYPPPAESTGLGSIYGSNEHHAHSVAKDCRERPDLSSGIKFYHQVMNRYRTWHHESMLPAFLIWLDDVLSGTNLIDGYRYFLCHPLVFASPASTKAVWFICCLIDHLAPLASTTKDHYAITPKLSGTMLQFLMQIYSNFISSRFTFPTKKEITDAVVCCFANKLSDSEKEKLTTTSASITDDIFGDFEVLRDFLTRHSLLVTGLRSDANHLPRVEPQAHAGDKRKEKEDCPPQAHQLCADPNSCKLCLDWVMSVFQCRNICIRCFEVRSHSTNACFHPITWLSHRCASCGYLKFNRDHSSCAARCANNQCHKCGERGHFNSVCPASKAVCDAHKAKRSRHS
jgi:hypothetical protein